MVRFQADLPGDASRPRVHAPLREGSPPGLHGRAGETLPGHPPALPGIGPGPARAVLLALQRCAGNSAVCAFLEGARHRSATPRPPAAPAAQHAPTEVQRCEPDEPSCACPPARQPDAGPRGGDATVDGAEMGSVPAVARVQRAAGNGSGGPAIVVQRERCNRVWVDHGAYRLPDGTLQADFLGRYFGAWWDMSGSFRSDPPAAAACGPYGEYRQQVRGSFTRNGQPVPKRLPGGVMLDPSTLHEDGNNQGLKFGYHSIPFTHSEFSNPDQATGQTWTGQDHPSIWADDGDRVKVDLEFQGAFIDTREPATPLRQSTWKVVGEGVHATTPATSAPSVPASGSAPEAPAGPEGAAAPADARRRSRRDRGCVITASSEPEPAG
jgi:hypothetical protein